MNTHDKIELPPLPDLPAYSPEVFDREVKVVSETMVEQLMHDYARAAIEAYLKRRGDIEAQLEEALTDRDDYHDIADQLAEQIAAITEQKIGEHSSGNSPWKNAMLAADEWMAKDIRRLTDGVDRKRRGEPVKVLSKDEIREVFLANGFTIKPGHDDLKPYVYAAARELIALTQWRAGEGAE